MHGMPAAARPTSPRGTQVGVEAERVDHRRQPSLQASGDDLVEHGERVGRRTQIVLGLADDCTQRVAGDDLIGREVRGGPRRLAGGDRPDQDDQARRRDACERLA